MTIVWDCDLEGDDRPLPHPNKTNVTETKQNSVTLFFILNICDVKVAHIRSDRNRREWETTH
jgi:hypothetical protein